LSLYLQGGLGILALFAIAWVFTENRRVFPWKGALIALILQFAVALVLFNVEIALQGLVKLNGVVVALQDATREGTTVVFGYLGGGALPFQESFPGASFILAFQALPLVLVISALSALLWHWRVLPAVIGVFALLFRKLFGLRGSVSVAAAANIFVGMVEAPLLVRPLFEKLSRSDLFVVMTCGMATVAGTVMVLYASLISKTVPGSLGHLIVASVISIPAAIVLARILVPETDTGDVSELDQETSLKAPSPYHGAMDAITSGTQNGLALLLAIVAMLTVAVALVALSNSILGLLPDVGGAALSLQRIFAWIFAPIMWLLGIEAAEISTTAQLMGIKTVLNEFLAYLELAKIPAEALSDRSRLIITYALSGFANFGSLGIMIGGLVAMAPDRRRDIVSLGLKSILAGTLASSMTGAIVGFVA